MCEVNLLYVITISLLTVGSRQNGGRHDLGGMILQIPYFSASLLIDEMYWRGLENSCSVGWNVGAGGQ